MAEEMAQDRIVMATLIETRKAPEPEGTAKRVVKVFSSLPTLEASSMLRRSLFGGLRFPLVSTLFEVNNNTVPWGLHLVGAITKGVNAWARRKDGTIDRRLNSFLEIKVSASAKPINGVSSKDIVIGKDPNIWARIFTPSQGMDGPIQDDSPKPVEKLPVLIYYHGGGFGVLSPDFLYYDRLCRAICKTCNVVVVSVNYRLAPEHRYPVAYDDSFEALEWLQSPDSATHLPSVADVSQCFIAGDSAGGNIVHFMGCRAAERDLTPVQIRGAILLQPFFGSEERTPAELILVNVPIISVEATDWYWKAFLPQEGDRDHPVCNVFGPNARDISNLSLPPMFVVTSSLDVLKDHQARYVSRVQQMGKVLRHKHYMGGVHGFYFLEHAGTKLALECIADIKEFIESCLDGSVHIPVSEEGKADTRLFCSESDVGQDPSSSKLGLEGVVVYDHTN